MMVSANNSVERDVRKLRLRLRSPLTSNVMFLNEH